MYTAHHEYMNSFSFIFYQHKTKAIKTEDNEMLTHSLTSNHERITLLFYFRVLSKNIEKRKSQQLEGMRWSRAANPFIIHK